MTPVRTRIIAAAAIAAGLAAGATGVALADNTPTSTVSPTPSASPSAGAKGDGARPRPPKGLRPGGRPGPGMLDGRGALHGEFVVPNGSSGFRTIVVQRGEVTAVSATQITVHSKDGFTTTYAVTADTLVNAARDGIATIKKGATVNVAATKAGNKITAVHIGDQSARKAMKERLGLDGSATGV
jgi:hypothetical protein